MIELISSNAIDTAVFFNNVLTSEQPKSWIRDLLLHQNRATRRRSSPRRTHVTKLS